MSLRQGDKDLVSPDDGNRLPLNLDKSELVLSEQHDMERYVDLEMLRDEFPPLPSDSQSILVSLSTRYVLKASVCQRAHLFRIKYYGYLINLWVDFFEIICLIRYNSFLYMWVYTVHTIIASLCKLF